MLLRERDGQWAEEKSVILSQETQTKTVRTDGPSPDRKGADSKGMRGPSGLFINALSRSFVATYRWVSPNHSPIVIYFMLSLGQCLALCCKVDF